jgi:hypothetical protein
MYKDKRWREIMKKIQWVFLFYAILAVFSMIGIAISISYENILLILLFTLALIVIMGLGFQRKKKLQAEGKLD